MFQWEKEHLVGVSTVPNILWVRESLTFQWNDSKKLFELFVIILKDIILQNGCIGETIGDRVRPTRTGTGSGPLLWTPCGHLAETPGLLQACQSNSVQDAFSLSFLDPLEYVSLDGASPQRFRSLLTLHGPWNFDKSVEHWRTYKSVLIWRERRWK